MCPVQAAAAQPVRVSRDALLWLYAIVPLGILVPLLDASLFDGAVRRALPGSPDQLLFWTVVFNVPHLVASQLLLLDREYLRHYRLAILISSASIALLIALSFTNLFPLAFWNWFGAVAVTYHVIGQQVGILRMMGGGDPGKLLTAWKLLGVVAYLLGLWSALPPELALNGFVTPHTLQRISALVCVLLSLCALDLWRRLRSTRARLYLLANHVMFLAFVPLAATGYAFFLLVMPRFVHDLTAFMFYVNHDLNRNRRTPRGLLYRALGFTRLPAWLLLPAVSIGIGQLLLVVDPWLTIHPIGTISLFHYAMEGVVWRSSGLHRRSVALA